MIIHKSAEISLCRQYRYSLMRLWDPQIRCAMFICLNPSTADEINDDPTVRRCIRFARDWGYGGLVMANIFAYRATDPNHMMAAIDPIGPENDLRLKSLADKAGIIVAAWGSHGSYQKRGTQVIQLLPPMFCLGLTKNGNPKHPLYLKSDSTPQPLSQCLKEELLDS